MDRRSLIRSVGATTVAAATGATLGPTAATAQENPKIKWRLTSSFPTSTDVIFGGAKIMAEHVRAATNGNFEIQIFAGGEIVPGLQALDAVSTGTVEMCHTCSFYFWGKDPTFSLGSSPPFLNSRLQNAWLVNGGTDMLNEFYHKYNVHAFPCGNCSAQMGGWFRKEIKSVDDLKGLKFRIGGFVGVVLAKLGVVPQQIAPGDVYPALEKGTIDGVELNGPYDDLKLGFYKVAKYYYHPGWFEGGTVVHAMVNLDKYRQLPEHYKAILSDACHFANTWMLARFDALNPPALRECVAKGTVLRAFSREILDACYSATREIYAETSAKNENFKRIHESQLAFARNGYQWLQVADAHYDAYMIAQQRAGNI